MKAVFLNLNTNQLSFTYIQNENVCVGETDGSLEDFIEFLKQDLIKRNFDLKTLPTIYQQDYNL